MVVTVEDVDSWRIRREIVRICEDQIEEGAFFVGEIGVDGVTNAGISPEFEKAENVHGRESQSKGGWMGLFEGKWLVSEKRGGGINK